MEAQNIEIANAPLLGTGIPNDRSNDIGKRLLYLKAPTNLYIDDIKSVKKNMVNCIQVKDSYYLTGKDNILTHNSEIVSRKLPPHFLGLFPDGKVLLAGHTAELTVGFSKEARDLILNRKYQELFPNIQINPLESAAGHWKIAGHQGECFATGLGGSMAGQGYTLGIVDDYIRNRQDAESPTTRDSKWQAVKDDFLTRRAPVSITIITATRWHEDDVIGRIIKEMKENEKFPKFKLNVFPAFSDTYKEGVLFPERFSKDWYEGQRASLGEYGTASLLQCDPIIRGGNLFKIDNIRVHKSATEFPPNLLYWRVWDLAHTIKQRNSDNPDYTSGTLLSFRKKPGEFNVWELWIKNIVRMRAEAPERDRVIRYTAETDGPSVKVGIEDTIDSKDAFIALQRILAGKCIIHAAKVKGDKMVRATPLEPIFEAGNVHILDGPYLEPWKAEVASFPGGAHDDMIDNMSAGYALCCKSGGVTLVDTVGI